MVNDIVIDNYAQCFIANEGRYVEHNPPYEINSETHKCKFSSVYYAKENGDYKPLKRSCFIKHLSGDKGLALEPLIADSKGVVNSCRYAIIDIDSYKGKEQFLPIISKLQNFGFRFAPVRSKSGGLHLYFLFNDAEPAGQVIGALNRIVHLFALDKIFVSSDGSSKVEIFPMHSMQTNESNGKCVFLPYFNSVKPLNPVINSKGEELDFESGVNYFMRSKTTLAELEATFDLLPYQDAPVCIQSIALSGRCSARNEFLFHSCVYFKHKYDADFYNHLLKLDGMLDNPLQSEDETELKNIYESALKKEYPYNCKKLPMKTYCNKELCITRKFTGVVKKGKDNTNAGFVFGLITKIDTREPYYQWELGAEEGSTKQIKFGSIVELSDQTKVQQACWKELGLAHNPVNRDTWTGIINSSMSGIQDRIISVSSEEDTTELGELFNLIDDFLISSRGARINKMLILLDQVYYDGSNFWFLIKGLQTYLRIKRFTLKGKVLSEQLKVYGAQLSVLNLNGIDTDCWTVKCDARLKEKMNCAKGVLDMQIEIAKSIEIEDTPEGKEDKGSITDEELEDAPF